MHIHAAMRVHICWFWMSSCRFNLMDFFFSVDFTNLKPPVMDGLDALLVVSISL